MTVVDRFSLLLLALDWSFSFNFDDDASFLDGDFDVAILSAVEALFFFLSLVGVLGLFELFFLETFDFTSEVTTAASMSFANGVGALLLLGRLFLAAIILSESLSPVVSTKNWASSSLE